MPPGWRDTTVNVDTVMLSKVAPTGLVEWGVVLSALVFGVSVPLLLFDPTTLFSYHPSAMALSFGVLMPLGGFVAVKTRLLKGTDRLASIWLHSGLQTFAVACSFWGFVAIWVNKNIQGKSHFVTTHAQLGVLSVVLTIAALLLGALNFQRLGLLRLVPEEYRSTIKWAHRRSGAVAAGTAALCILTAIDHPAVETQAGFGVRSLWKLAVVGVGVGLVRMGMHTSQGAPNEKTNGVELGKYSKA